MFQGIGDGDRAREQAEATLRLVPESRGKQLRAYFEDRELLFEPGAGFQYSNFNYNLLAIIAEAVTGTPYAFQMVANSMPIEPAPMMSTDLGSFSCKMASQ